MYSGKYNCKRQGCWWSAAYTYINGKDYGKYSATNPSCSICQDKCDNDVNCGAVECGGEEPGVDCHYWKVGMCIDETSPNFVTYDKDQYKYGYTCYKGICLICIYYPTHRIINTYICGALKFH